MKFDRNMKIFSIIYQKKKICGNVSHLKKSIIKILHFNNSSIRSFRIDGFGRLLILNFNYA